MICMEFKRAGWVPAARQQKKAFLARRLFVSARLDVARAAFEQTFPPLGACSSTCSSDDRVQNGAGWGRLRTWAGAVFWRAVEVQHLSSPAGRRLDPGTGFEQSGRPGRGFRAAR